MRGARRRLADRKVLLLTVLAVVGADPALAQASSQVSSMPGPAPVCVEVEVAGRKVSATAECLSLQLQIIAQRAHLAATSADRAPGPAMPPGGLTAASQRLGYDLRGVTRLTPRRSPDKPVYSPFRPPR